MLGCAYKVLCSALARAPIPEIFFLQQYALQTVRIAIFYFLRNSCWGKIALVFYSKKIYFFTTRRFSSQTDKKRWKIKSDVKAILLYIYFQKSLKNCFFIIFHVFSKTSSARTQVVAPSQFFQKSGIKNLKMAFPE